MTRFVLLGLRQTLVLLAVALPAFTVPAQNRTANYDEDKIPPYTLPDPLILKVGSPVTDASMWTKNRRPEVLELFRSQVYGHSPEAPRNVHLEFLSLDKNALGGLA